VRMTGDVAGAEGQVSAEHLARYESFRSGAFFVTQDPSVGDYSTRTKDSECRRSTRDLRNPRTCRLARQWS
jgi:hypothetical protein